MIPKSVMTVMLVITLAVAYFLAGKLGLIVAQVHPSATAVWPPTGIALWALLWLGFRVWPGVFLGAFLVNMTTVGSMVTSVAIAVGNTLEGVLGAYLVNKFANGLKAFDRLEDVVKFVVLAGLSSTTVSAMVGVTSLAWAGYANWKDFEAIWVTWWLGDTVGNLAMAPLLILWSQGPHTQWTRRQRIEAALLLLVLILVGQIVFGGWLPTKGRAYPLSFLCMPILVWAALRFSPRETATAVFLMAGIAIWGTWKGYGPFVLKTTHESLLLLQAFVGTTAGMALAFASIMSERRRAEGEREQLILELRDALDHIKTLRGLLPICAYCKKIRNDQGYWDHIETYIQAHSDARFTHGMCPECLEEWRQKHKLTG